MGKYGAAVGIDDGEYGVSGVADGGGGSVKKDVTFGGDDVGVEWMVYLGNKNAVVI